MPPRQSRQINRMYFAKGVAATAAIEGNTLSEKEVGERIKALDKGEKPTVPRSQEYRTQEIDNITQACHDVAKQVFDEENPASMVITDIENYNGRLLEKLSPAEGSPPGKVRQNSVVVGRYRGAPAEDCRFLLERLCKQLEDWYTATSEDSNADTITFAVLRAIYAHLYLAWIHPFADGNGRMARLVANLPVLRAGLPPIIIPREQRKEYIDALSAWHFAAGQIKAGEDLVPKSDQLEPFTELCRQAWQASISLVEEALKRQEVRDSAAESD